MDEKEKIRFIDTFRNKYDLKDLFDVLEISISNYYKYWNTIDKDYSDSNIIFFSKIFVILNKFIILIKISFYFLFPILDRPCRC